MEPVYTISIIPTGMGAAGYTMPLPENDEMFMTRGKMLQEITTLLGGRVAEEIIFGDITTGASNDIKRATEIARSMIMKYGMSDTLGLVAYDEDDGNVFIGRDLAHTKGYSEEVARVIDAEVRRIMEECHDRAASIIHEYENVLHSCAALLLEQEKVHRDEFERLNVIVVGIGVPDGINHTLEKAGYVSGNELKTLVDKGAVGDMCLQFFDKDGNTDKLDFYNERVAAMRLEEIRRIPSKIAIAGGKRKAEAVIGAVRGGYINILITDTECAKQLIELAKKH